MKPNELLERIHHEVTLAKALTDTIVHAVNNAPAVDLGECRNCIEEMTRHLREASCAAPALRSLSAGNELPKEG
jgi:hypothetical protein